MPSLDAAAVAADASGGALTVAGMAKSDWSRRAWVTGAVRPGRGTSLDPRHAARTDPCPAAIAAALQVETGNAFARRRGERELAELSHVLAREVFGFDAIVQDRDDTLPRVARFAVLEAVRRHGPPPQHSSPEWAEWVARVSSAARIRMRAFR